MILHWLLVIIIVLISSAWFLKKIIKASSLGRKNVVNLLLAHDASVNMTNKFKNNGLILGSEINNFLRYELIIIYWLN